MHRKVGLSSLIFCSDDTTVETCSHCYDCSTHTVKRINILCSHVGMQCVEILLLETYI